MLLYSKKRESHSYLGSPNALALTLTFSISNGQFMQQIQCKEVIVNEEDIAKAIIDYVSNLTVEILVVGASTNTFSK